jgi:hypothetical protein
MRERTFHFRLHSSHPAPDRATDGLVVEFLTDSGEWQPQQLSLTMPGFRFHLIPLLLCQHVHIATLAERMKLCPISRNLPGSVRKRIGLTCVG